MFCIIRLSWTCGLDVFGGHASPYLVLSYFSVLKYQCPSSNNGAFAHLATVKQCGTHADECMVVNSTGMYGDVMTDGNVVSYVGRACFMGYMNTGAVLHIGAVTYRDGSHVAPNHGIKPNRTLVAHCHIAHYRGIFTEIAVLSPLRSQTSVTLYQSHYIILLFYLSQIIVLLYL